MVEKTQKQPADILRCPCCGGSDVAFDEKAQKLRCKSCHTLFDSKTANSAGGIEELDHIATSDEVGTIIPDEKSVLTLRCPSCGAEVVIDANDATTARCHWCRHVLSVTDKLPNGAVLDLILPFKVKKNTAFQSMQKYVKDRGIFVSNKLKKDLKLENVAGVYLPYMVIDINAHANLIGEGERCKKSYFADFNDGPYRCYDADGYNITREFDLLVDDLTIEASADKLNQDIREDSKNVINAILPFDTENAVAWDARYLRGYTCERRDVNVDVIVPFVQNQVKSIARYSVFDDISKTYDRGVRWWDYKITYKGTKWKTAYLPVWLYSFVERDKKGTEKRYFIAVNARTGEVKGNTPLNRPRLYLITTGVEIISWILFWTVLAFNEKILRIPTDDHPLATIIMMCAMFLCAASGYIFHQIVLHRYRNSAYHNFEYETKVEVKNMKKTDVFAKSVKRLKSPRIASENSRDIDGSVVKHTSRKIGLEEGAFFWHEVDEKKKRKK